MSQDERVVPAFVGIEIYAQAALAHWPFKIRLTNAMADVIVQ